MVHTGGPADPDDDEIRAGAGLMRPLDAAALKAGVEILLEHRMTAIHREAANSGRVTRHRRRSQRREAQHSRAQGRHRRHRRLDRKRQLPPHVRSAAHRGILRACRHAVVGSGRQRRDSPPWMIGASLWGLFNYTGEFGSGITKPGAIGCQYGYVNVRWHPGSEVFDKARAIGLAGQGLAGCHPGQHAGQALLRRDRRPLQLQHLSRAPIPTSRTAISTPRTIKYNPSNFINAALAGIGDGHNGGGPIWAIFDADACRAREVESEAAACRCRRRLLLQRLGASTSSPARSK